MNDDMTPSESDQLVLDALGELTPLEPPGDLRDRFHLRAQTELTVGRTPRWWMSAALAAALVLALGGGWWADRVHHEAEVAQLRTQLATALKDLSAATRLQAITAAGNSGARDPRVVEALTQALLTDPSTNVRVAAANALGRVAPPAELEEAAMRSIGKESSPFVQAALVEATAALPAAERVRVLRQILSRSDLDPEIRAEAEHGVHS